MKRIVIIAITATLAVTSLSTKTAIGMPDPGIIAANCVAAQSILSQIEKSDVGSRINRGHDYSQISDLMFAMNARLASNKIAAPELSKITAQFEKELVTFRADYSDYDDSLSELIELKCFDEPTSFYEKLQSTRALRAKLKSDVNSLDNSIKSYYDGFGLIAKEVES